jgi:DNA repair protein RecO (recombination protein O)
MIVETDAIVLHTRKYSDSSKIVELYSKEFGKISILAKGAYSIKSKFVGCLEPLSIIHISFYKKVGTELYLLKTSELLIPLNQIHKTSNTLITGLTIAEFISYTQNECPNSADLYNKFTTFLYKINEHSERSFGIAIQFLIFLTDNMGFSVLVSKDIYGKKINNLISENDLQNVMNTDKYIDFINSFAHFFSNHLGKNINIKSTAFII